MNRTAYIERKNQLNLDEKKLVLELEKRNIPIKYFSPKQLERGKIKIIDPFLVAGNIKSMQLALKSLNKPFPLANTYPKALNQHYHREIWESTLKEALFDFKQGKNYLIKPKNDFKTFTGFLLNDLDNHGNQGKSIYSLINRLGKEYPIICSESIKIKSEFRAYVSKGILIECVWYFGDKINIDKKIVLAAVNALSSSNENLEAYALDFAILKDGSTVVLELNEGFGIDSYSSSSYTYYQVIKNRWDELYK